MTLTLISLISMKRNLFWWAILLMGQTILFSGCTSALWDKNTFYHSYEPARPANLQLFYSEEKRDVLVQYDEARDGAERVRHRNYYADQNAERVNNHRRPHFTSAPGLQNMHQIPITNAPAGAASSSSFQGLYATSLGGADSFTLYSKDELLDSYILPRYAGRSQRFKQVLLTPFAVAIDCTVVGGMATLYFAPLALSGLSGESL